MPEHGSDPRRDEIERIIAHYLSNLGIGTEGEGRDRTQKALWWAISRSQIWDSDIEQKDRSWVRAQRERHEKRGDGTRTMVYGVLSAIGAAIVLSLLTHGSAIVKALGG